MPIGTNLDQALRRMRQPYSKRKLWVDALSISQSNLEEKAQQVKMISKIFRQAGKVLLWLGEHEDESETLFKSSPEADVWREIELRAQIRRSSLIQPSREDVSRMVNPWLEFLARPYWTRTWILQEITCAKTPFVCCGPDALYWDRLIGSKYSHHSRSVELVSQKLKELLDTPQLRRLLDVQRAITKICNARNIYTAQQSGIKHMQLHWGAITSFIDATEDTKCADRRDKVYAVLSLESRDSVRRNIGVDYTIDVPTLAVRVLRADPDPGSASPEWTMIALLKAFKLTDHECGLVVSLILQDHSNLNKTLLDAAD